MRSAACEAHTPPAAPTLAQPLGGSHRAAVPLTARQAVD